MVIHGKQARAIEAAGGHVTTVQAFLGLDDDEMAAIDADVAAERAARASFRARLAAASFSRREMATVMAETLRALGYDMTAWDDGLALVDGADFYCAWRQPRR